MFSRIRIWKEFRLGKNIYDNQSWCIFLSWDFLYMMFFIFSIEPVFCRSCSERSLAAYALKKFFAAYALKEFYAANALKRFYAAYALLKFCRLCVDEDVWKLFIGVSIIKTFLNTGIMISYQRDRLRSNYSFHFRFITVSEKSTFEKKDCFDI